MRRLSSALLILAAPSMAEAQAGFWLNEGSFRCERYFGWYETHFSIGLEGGLRVRVFKNGRRAPEVKLGAEIDPGYRWLRSAEPKASAKTDEEGGVFLRFEADMGTFTPRGDPRKNILSFWVGDETCDVSVNILEIS